MCCSVSSRVVSLLCVIASKQKNGKHAIALGFLSPRVLVVIANPRNLCFVIASPCSGCGNPQGDSEIATSLTLLAMTGCLFPSLRARAAPALSLRARVAGVAILRRVCQSLMGFVVTVRRSPRSLRSLAMTERGFALAMTGSGFVLAMTIRSDEKKLMVSFLRGRKSRKCDSSYAVREIMQKNTLLKCGNAPFS